MANYSFNRPVQKNGKLTNYAKMLLEIHEEGSIEIVETRRRMKYMTYQHMFEFGLIDSVKQHGTRRHKYVLTQSGVDLVKQILRTQRTSVIKINKDAKKVKLMFVENLKQQIKEAEAKLDKIQKDSEEETYRKLINGTVKVKIKESYKGKYDSLRKFPLHVFRVNDNGMAKCAISDSGAELTFEIHYSALEPINRATIRKMFTNFY